MNKSITMKTALAALACTACVSASAQKQYPEQEKMKPGMSEYCTGCAGLYDFRRGAKADCGWKRCYFIEYRCSNHDAGCAWTGRGN